MCETRHLGIKWPYWHRMNPKNPTSREKQDHEDSGHAVYRSWCAACVEGRGVGGQHRIELLEEEERERTTPIAAFDYMVF